MLLSPRLMLATALVIASGAALAQDFASRTSTGGTADFSGVGLGIDVGAGMGSAGRAGTSFDPSGLIGGGHVGYNFQAQRIVGGAEVDLLTSRMRSGSVLSMSYRQNSLSSVRAKAGYVFGDLLAYGTVGYGYSTASYRDLSGSSDRTIKGAVYGGGVDYALTRNVSVRGEYLRYNFGTQTYVTPLSTLPISSNTNLLRAGASVHF